MSSLVLLAPVSGWVAPLSEVPDPVFAGGMIGEGLAIDPVGEAILAPCDAEVIKLHAARHAVTLRAANGAEILVHVGLDTVALGGVGFQAHVRDGDQVRAGQILISFDLDAVARRAPSVITPVVLTNAEAFAITWRAAGGEIAAGERLMELAPIAAAMTAQDSTAGAELSRRVTVTHAHGLHARPAALIAAEAKRHPAAAVEIALAGRRASARGAVALMSLGVRGGDEIVLTARGDRAEAALAAIAEVIAAINAAPEPDAAPAQAAPAPVQAAAPNLITGVRAAPGFAMGVAVLFAAAAVRVDETSAGVAAETARLDAALAAVAARLARQAEALSGERRAVLEAHLAMLSDEDLVGEARRAVVEGRSAGAGWRDTLAGHMAALQALGDARLAERATDLKDLQRQVLLELSGERSAAIELPAGAILLADDLMPSDLAGLDPARLGGLCTAGGGPTSHVAVMAAAMGVPAVVAAGPRVLGIRSGTPVILDGEAGSLAIAPDAAALAAAQARLAEREARKAKLARAAHDAAITLDGLRIAVRGNVGSPADARIAAASGAEGCGLLRTEFLFLDRQTPPDEAEQARQYQAVAEALAGRPVAVRTLDVGGDKPAPYLDLPAEENPALGLRGVRVSLRQPDLLRVQLRAILGVQPTGQCRIMVPMVASLGELRAVRALVDEVAAERGDEPGAPPILLGVMIETPAAAVTADLIAAEADFLSIGTNDLAQYALAMDRGNPALAAQVDALHPAVLRLIGVAANGGQTHGKPVSVCGGLASDLAAVPILIGLGVTELSAAPAMIPEVKALIRTLDAAACRDLAERACAEVSAAAVRGLALTDLTIPAIGGAPCSTSAV